MPLTFYHSGSWTGLSWWVRGCFLLLVQLLEYVRFFISNETTIMLLKCTGKNFQCLIVYLVNLMAKCTTWCEHWYVLASQVNPRFCAKMLVFVG